MIYILANLSIDTLFDHIDGHNVYHGHMGEMAVMAQVVMARHMAKCFKIPYIVVWKRSKKEIMNVMEFSN